MAQHGPQRQAAALLHSLARNHALIDGNERLAVAATIAFLGIDVATIGDAIRNGSDTR